VLVGLGCWYLVDTSSVKFSGFGGEEGLTSLFHSAAVIICVIGAVIIVVGVIGCVATCLESYACLIVVRILRCYELCSGSYGYSNEKTRL